MLPKAAKFVDQYDRLFGVPIRSTYNLPMSEFIGDVSSFEGGHSYSLFWGNKNIKSPATFGGIQLSFASFPSWSSSAGGICSIFMFCAKYRNIVTRPSV
jgi:hypothetical protein